VLGSRGIGLVSDELDHIITAVMDVFAKSAYGFALLYFRLYFDKKLVQSGVDAEEFAKFSQETIKVLHKGKGKGKGDEDHYAGGGGNNYGGGGGNNYGGNNGYQDNYGGHGSNDFDEESGLGINGGEGLQSKIRKSLQKRHLKPENGDFNNIDRGMNRDDMRSPSANNNGVHRDQMMGRSSQNGSSFRGGGSGAGGSGGGGFDSNNQFHHLRDQMAERNQTSTSFSSRVTH
jgi:hypothetical protein